MANSAETSPNAANGAHTPAFSAAARVRRAGGADAEVLHRVAAATFPLACPPHTTAAAIAEFIASTLSEARFVEYLADPERELFLAEIDGTAVGYTMVVYGEPTDADAAAVITARPTAELSKCYVMPDQHGAGIAAALVDRSVDAARARGARTLWLGVNEENQRANRFYEKQGFVTVGRKRFLVGGRYEDDYVRERGLD
jgi:ribosomal protein S18 acetylase RimI-like enzyme